MQISIIDIHNKKQIDITDILTSFSPPKRLVVRYPMGGIKTRRSTAITLFQRIQYNVMYLEYATFNCFNPKSYDRAMIIRVLESCASNLKLVAFRNSELNLPFVMALHSLAKTRYEQNKPINVQVYRIYYSDFTFRKLSMQRVGYVLSLTSKFCNDVFHTQVDSSSNSGLFRYFLTSADFAGRKKKRSFVSLGACYQMPTYVYSNFKAIYPHVKVYHNPTVCYFHVVKNGEIEFFENLTEDEFTQ